MRGRRPLVLVHGTASVHTTWDAVVPYLAAEATVYAMDRRGRAGSGDGSRYAFEREVEDVMAVVDGAARTTGIPVDLLGRSFR
ncbi:MAG: alpha/beta fold hydrolase [Chloroflexota bacterium]|nr:alpha/beta fold hydrolase [Chloroflexota bacterium]